MVQDGIQDQIQVIVQLGSHPNCMNDPTNAYLVYYSRGLSKISISDSNNNLNNQISAQIYAYISCSNNRFNLEPHLRRSRITPSGNTSDLHRTPRE